MDGCVGIVEVPGAEYIMTRYPEEPSRPVLVPIRGAWTASLKKTDQCSGHNLAPPAHA